MTGAGAVEGTGIDGCCVRQGRISREHGMPAENFLSGTSQRKAAVFW